MRPPPRQASSPPRPLLAYGRAHAGGAKNHRLVQLRRCSPGAVPAGAMPAERRSACDRARPRCPGCRERGGFLGCCHPGGWRLGLWGCDARGTRLGGGGGLCRARGPPWVASPLRTLQPAPAAGQAQGGWNGEAAFSGGPKAQETRQRGRLPARSLAGEPPRPFAFSLRHRHPEAGAGGGGREPNAADRYLSG